MTYSIEYYAGTYRGVMQVEADDSDEAIAKARAKVRRQMSLSMYADGYKVADCRDEQETSK